ncbi:MAG: PAS domain S-box protein [Aestuariibacter sp.]
MKPYCSTLISIMVLLLFARLASGNVVLDSETFQYKIGKHVLVLEDPTGNFSIEDILSPDVNDRFIPKHKDVFSLGFSDTVFWLKFTLINPASDAQWLLEQRWPNTHYMSLYWLDPVTQQIQKLQDGSLSTAAGSSISHRRPLFDITFPKGLSRTFYLRIDSEAAKVVNLRLWQKEAFLHAHPIDSLILGSFYGALLLIAFSNYLLFFYFHRNSQLWLASFVLSLAVSFGIFEGLHTWLLPVEWQPFALKVFVPLSALTMNFLLVYAQRLFNRHLSGLTRRGIHLFHGMFLVVVVLSFFYVIRYATLMLIVTFLICITALFLYAGRLLIAGNHLVRFFTLGLLCFMVGGYVQVMFTLGLISESNWTMGVARVGVLLMAVFFTFAFVDVVKWLTKEKSRINSALQQTEQKFKAIFQQSFQLSALLSREGRILDVNEPIAELNLMPAKKMLGLPLWDVTNTSDNLQTRKRLKKEFKRAQGGETRRLEMQIETVHGELKWLDISLKPLKNNQNIIDSVLAEARDISRQKKIQQALTSLAETASSHSGRNFFENAVVQLCEVFASDYAMIVSNGDAESARTVAVCKQRKLLTNITFPINGTPLADQQDGDALLVVEGAITKYPGDPLINSFQMDYYIACPILTSQMETIGHVVLMNHKALYDTDRMLDVLQVFAARIGSELESQRASKLLQDTRQRLSAHLKNTPLAVIELDNKLRVTEWNTAAFHMYGYTRDEVIGKKVSELILNRDGYMDDDELQLLFFSNIEGQYSRMSNVAKDGVRLVCDWYKTLLYNEYGELNGVAALVADVSIEQRALRELRKQERDQRIILDSLLDSVIAIDKLGHIISINKMTEKMFGYQEDELLGKKINMLMPKEFAREHDHYLSQFEETGEAKVIGLARNLKAKRKNGSLFPIRLTITELAGSEVTDAGFIGFIHDMTEVQRQEEQIRRSQKMDALGKLTGGIAHDFNNLMGIILGYAEFITFGAKPDTDAAKYAAEIVKAGERGANLTKKLLSFSKAHAGNQQIVDINQILSNSEDLLKKTITPRIGLNMVLASNLDRVRIDKNDLEDALLNMSINATHAIEGSGTITIETQNCYFDEDTANTIDIKPGEYVLLSVADTGIGMTEETLHNIFDPFYSTKGEMGTGLGLSQVYGFVERSNGTIRVTSKPGAGSSFKLFFPKCEQAEHTPSLVQPLHDEKETLGGRETILLVEDEIALLRIVAESISRYGYQVETAESAAKALQLLEECEIDVLLTDVVMPDMDGYELADIVRERYPAIKIQLASGYTEQRNDSEEDVELNNNILSKPYQTKTVLKHIRALLEAPGNDHAPLQNDE